MGLNYKVAMMESLVALKTLWQTYSNPSWLEDNASSGQRYSPKLFDMMQANFVPNLNVGGGGW